MLPKEAVGDRNNDNVLDYFYLTREIKYKLQSAEDYIIFIAFWMSVVYIPVIDEIDWYPNKHQCW